MRAASWAGLRWLGAAVQLGIRGVERYAFPWVEPREQLPVRLYADSTDLRKSLSTTSPRQLTQGTYVSLSARPSHFRRVFRLARPQVCVHCVSHDPGDNIIMPGDGRNGCLFLDDFFVF